MRWWVLLLAGCYGANPSTGVPCDPREPHCPSGQVCVARAGGFVCDVTGGDVIDAPTALPGDDDGDGVANATDNCRTKPNSKQENEDGDAEGDACDNCPPFVSDGKDGDSDGVGDLCDPRPAMAGDVMTLFEGFANGLPAGWQATGMWTVSNGDLRSTVNNNDLGTLVVPYAATKNQTISAYATITALGGNTGGSIGIVDRFDGDQGLHCGGGRMASLALFGIIDAATGQFVNGSPHPFAAGTVYKLTFTRVDDRYTCSTLQSNGMKLDVEYNNVPTVGGPSIGFRNRVASASFPWLMVVKSP